MNGSNRKPRLIRPILFIMLAAVILASVGYYFLLPKKEKGYEGALYTVGRKDLVISVLESSSIESAKALEIKSRVEGRQTILSLIPDGTVLTEEDVRKGRVLVELDSSALAEKEAQQNITFQSAQADYTQAKESYEIQKNQNESNIQAGELTVKFGRMDFERYLGVELAKRILGGQMKLSALSIGEADMTKAARLLDDLGLGGAARKEWQKLQSDIDLADENVKRAESDYEWSKELGPRDPNDPKSAGKGYIAKSDVEADRLKLQARLAEAAQAKLAKDLFLRYDLPKQAEKLYSDYFEAQRELERIRAKARAELAKAESKMKSKEAAYKLQTTRLEKLRRQIRNCTIRAPKPGMIVYASTTDRRGRQEDVIEEGAQVRERQVLLRIPDPSSVSIKVQVNESSINKVKIGQKVKIVAEPFPDKVMWGTVRKVSVTPDPTYRWMSPDTQTYTTVVSIESPIEKLKPGMSAKAEIIIDRVENVLAVPVQAVSILKGIRVCYVMKPGKTEARPVEIGQANNNFIAIHSGLRAGEKILLHKPEVADEALVEQAATKRKAEAREQIQKAAGQSREARVAPGEKPKAETASAAASAAASDEPAWLKRIPAERREAALKRWQAMTPEERKAAERQTGRTRKRPRRSAPPGGEQ